MITLYLEFGLVEFKDATSKGNPRLEAANDSIRASDELKGLRRGPKRGSASDEPANESDEEDSSIERPNKRLRSASSTKTAEPASTSRTTRGSNKTAEPATRGSSTLVRRHRPQRRKQNHPQLVRNGRRRRMINY